MAGSADHYARNTAPELVIFCLLDVGIVTGGADDLTVLVERQLRADALRPVGIDGEGVVEIPGVGIRLVAAEAEDVGARNELHGVDSVTSRDRAPGMTEPAPLPRVDVEMGIAAGEGLRVVAVAAEIIAVGVGPVAQKFSEIPVLGMAGGVAGKTGEGPVSERPALWGGNGRGHSPEGMGVGDDLPGAVAAVAQLDGVLVPEGIALPVFVAGETEALSIMGIEGDHIHGGGDVLRLQTAGTLGSEVRVVAGKALGGGFKRAGELIVAVLNGTVTEIAQVRPAGGDFRGLSPLDRLALVAESTGPVVTAVGRPQRQLFAMAVFAEILPCFEKGGLLRSRESPEEGMVRFGCVVEVAGGADDLSLEIAGFSKREKGWFPTGDGRGARLDEYGVKILLRFVAIGAQRGIVEGFAPPESRRFPCVNAEARGLFVTEKAFCGVVLVGGCRKGDCRQGKGNGEDRRGDCFWCSRHSHSLRWALT